MIEIRRKLVAKREELMQVLLISSSNYQDLYAACISNQNICSGHCVSCEDYCAIYAQGLDDIKS